MPPKKNLGKSTAKSKPKTAGVKNSASDGDRVLRPKKGTDFKQLNSGKPAKAKEDRGKTSAKVIDDTDMVSLSPSTSDDDFGWRY